MNGIGKKAKSVRPSARPAEIVILPSLHDGDEQTRFEAARRAFSQRFGIPRRRPHIGRVYANHLDTMSSLRLNNEVMAADGMASSAPQRIISLTGESLSIPTNSSR